jgi:hypothetical protein
MNASDKKSILHQFSAFSESSKRACHNREILLGNKSSIFLGIFFRENIFCQYYASWERERRDFGFVDDGEEFSTIWKMTLSINLSFSWWKVAFKVDEGEKLIHEKLEGDSKKMIVFSARIINNKNKSWMSKKTFFSSQIIFPLFPQTIAAKVNESSRSSFFLSF